MTKNEIKKALYKEKPMAWHIHDSRKGSGGADAVSYVVYKTDTSLGEVYFNIPVHEMGETPFEHEVPAQLLIRWMVYITSTPLLDRALRRAQDGQKNPDAAATTLFLSEDDMWELRDEIDDLMVEKQTKRADSPLGGVNMRIDGGLTVKYKGVTMAFVPAIEGGPTWDWRS